MYAFFACLYLRNIYVHSYAQDPYVVLSLLDPLGNRVTGFNTKPVQAQTHVVFKNLNPLWKEALTLPISDLHGELLVETLEPPAILSSICHGM